MHILYFSSKRFRNFLLHGQNSSRKASSCYVLSNSRFEKKENRQTPQACRSKCRSPDIIWIARVRVAIPVHTPPMRSWMGPATMYVAALNAIPQLKGEACRRFAMPLASHLAHLSVSSLEHHCIVDIGSRIIHLSSFLESTTLANRLGILRGLFDAVNKFSRD